LEYWAVYILTLANESLDYRICTGSGTNAIDGVGSRILDYLHKIKSHLPNYVEAAFDTGSELQHVGLVCWCPIPVVSLVPRARARLLAVEALFTTLFSARRKVNLADNTRMLSLDPNGDCP
jgi:hypothetical protein